MATRLQPGDCVRIPDGRIGRLREVSQGRCRVRVRRTTSKTHQFLSFGARDLTKVDCPRGWMSPEGYLRYLKPTLAKQKERAAAKADRRKSAKKKD
jgi:hypothetical protein